MKRKHTGNIKYGMTMAVCLGLTAFALPVVGAGKPVFAQESAADQLMQEQRLNAWYSQSIQSINDGDFENALFCLDGCMVYASQEGNPTLYADLFLKRGYCCLMLGKHEEALEALGTALETDPELANAVLLEVSVYSDMGEYETAIDHLEQYIGMTGDESVYETMAQLYEAAGKTDEAYENYQKFTSATAETQAEAELADAKYLMLRGRYQDAVDLLSGSIDAGEAADGAYYSRGLCYMSLGDYEAAIADFASSVEKEETGFEDALQNKATCEMSILKYEDAIADFTACMDQEIEPANSRINRGICYLLSGSGQEAMEDFDACIEGDINPDEARFYRSFVYLAAKEYESALSDLGTCIENGYDPAASYAQRAQVYKEMGDSEAAAKDLEAAEQARAAQAEAAQAQGEDITEAGTETAEQ